MLKCVYGMFILLFYRRDKSCSYIHDQKYKKMSYISVIAVIMMDHS